MTWAPQELMTPLYSGSPGHVIMKPVLSLKMLSAWQLGCYVQTGEEGDGRGRLCLPPHAGKLSSTKPDSKLTHAWGGTPGDLPGTRGGKKLQVIVGDI